MRGNSLTCTPADVRMLTHLALNREHCSAVRHPPAPLELVVRVALYNLLLLDVA